jgi:hypothetical protein
MILFELLSGERPPVRMDASTVPVPSLPPMVKDSAPYAELFSVYNECTQLDPNKRPSAKKLLATVQAIKL